MSLPEWPDDMKGADYLWHCRATRGRRFLLVGLPAAAAALIAIMSMVVCRG